MIGKIKWILLIITHLGFASGVLFWFYREKYEPQKTEATKASATIKELRERIVVQDTIIARKDREYAELAKIPRYKIDQYLRGVKAKRGGKVEFVPSAVMKITDSLKLQEGDSIILQPKPFSEVKYRRHWWQYWRKKQPP